MTRSATSPSDRPNFQHSRAKLPRPNGIDMTLATLRAAAILFVAALFFSAPSRSTSQDWPNFRGSKFDNCFPDQKIPLDFGPDKHVLWKTPLASGLGSPCIIG